MFPWQPKVVGLRLLKEERKIVTVGNRLVREKPNHYRLRSETLSEQSWIVYLTCAYFNIVYISTHALQDSIIGVFGYLLG